VSGDSVFADHQAGRDLPVGSSGGHQAQHLQLPCCKSFRRDRFAGADKAANPLDVWHCTEVLERMAGGVELDLGAIGVRHGPAGQSDKDPDPGCFIGSLQLPPDRHRSTERVQGAYWITFRERYSALSLGGGRSEKRHPERLGDLEQLVSCVLGRADVVDGQHDLGVRRQHPAPADSIRGLVEYPRNRGCSDTGPTLGEAQQRQSGLRLSPDLARPAEGLGCLGKLPPQPMHLRQLVIGIGDRRPSRETIACADRLVQGSSPVAVQLQDLGPVHQALAGVRYKIWLTIAPPCKGRGPLLGAAQVVHLLATLDHVAIGESGQGRQKLISGHRDHGLIEQGQTGPGLSAGKSRSSLEHKGHSREVGVAESFGDLEGLAGGGQHFVVLACLGVIEGREKGQEATFGTVDTFAFDEALGSAQPTGSRPGFTRKSQHRAKPPGAAGGVQRLTVVQVGAVGPAHDSGEVLVPSGEVGRPGEQP
jgi:hypothetical protein